jgi:hypothetical protein
VKDKDKDKDRFYFWRNYWDALTKIKTNEERGRFVSAMCEYAFEDVEPDFSDNAVLDIAWTMISSQIRESVEIGRRQYENGQKGGRPKGKSKTTAKTTTKTSAKTTGLTTAKSNGETSAESVRYSNVPNADVASGEPTAPSASNASAEALARAMKYGFPEPPE